MVTPDGSIVAMDDATIVWKPKGDRQKRVRIEAQASVLLGLIGPRYSENDETREKNE